MEDIQPRTDLPFQWLQWFAFPALWVGFGTLAGLWPFHTWSPDGHAAAPTAVSMLHAGVLMKLGAFGVMRVGMVLLPQGALEWAVGGGVGGLREHLLRRGVRHVPAAT